MTCCICGHPARDGREQCTRCSRAFPELTPTIHATERTNP